MKQRLLDRFAQVLVLLDDDEQEHLLRYATVRAESKMASRAAPVLSLVPSGRDPTGRPSRKGSHKVENLAPLALAKCAK